MPICPNPECQHRVGGKIVVCPACGTEIPRPPGAGEYELLECVADTRTATIYRACKTGAVEPVCLRLYDADIVLSPEQVATLQRRFESLRELPTERFIHTLDFGRDAPTSRWYRTTPWLPNVKAWGDFKSQALQGDSAAKRQWLNLCLDLAESFRELHQHGRVIPDFTLDDCLLYRCTDGSLRVRLDATLASCLGPGSGREKVRESHPDFAPGHALSAQSDVWTLGGILVAMLAGTTEIVDYAQAMDAINAECRPVAIHPKLGHLLRQMVDPDPAERPRDMNSVCETLREFGPADIAEWNALESEPRRRSQLARRIAAIAAVAVAAVAILTATLYQRQSSRLGTEVGRVRDETSAAVSAVQLLVRDGKGYVDAQTQATVGNLLTQISATDPEQRAQTVLARCSPSVAFVLTEVWFEIDGERKTVALSSGTAFLVTADGYLLTNRHVVAPWLSGELAETVTRLSTQLRSKDKPFRFGVTHRLWFDGDEAFRSPYAAPSKDAALADAYRLDTAYADDSDGERRLRVAGVMPKPADPAELLLSTLEDDVAVLKIALVPAGAVPIPLRAGPPPPRGAGLLALGYSQGRGAIPGTRAAARCSRGTVSGVPADVITTDADLQPGNSGGPVFDLDGYAIGIASALFGSDGSVQTSMGRVLPIDTARRFLEAARSGQPAWDGRPETAFEPEIQAARAAAAKGDWVAARALVNADGVNANPDVALLAAGFSMDKTGLTPAGRAALERVVAMSPHYPFPALLLYWDAWRRGLPPAERPCRRNFLEAEWSSPFEPYRPIIRLLEGDLAFDKAEASAESVAEWVLLHWAAGTAAARDGNRAQAAKLLQAGLASTDPDDPLTWDLLAASLWFECEARPAATSPTSPLPPDRFAHLPQTFTALSAGDWTQAAKSVDRYFLTPRPENPNSLGMGLLRCQLQALTGNPAAGEQALTKFRQQTKNSWYARIADCLLGHTTPEALLATVAHKRPETLTLSVALALQAESRNDKPRALDLYRTALDTGQQNWLEYQLAQARREALGKTK